MELIKKEKINGDKTLKIGKIDFIKHGLLKYKTNECISSINLKIKDCEFVDKDNNNLFYFETKHAGKHYKQIYIKTSCKDHELFWTPFYLNLTPLEFEMMFKSNDNFNHLCRFDIDLRLGFEREPIKILITQDSTLIEQKKENVKEVIIEKPIIKEEVKPIKSIKSLIDYSMTTTKSFSMPSREERTKLCAIGSRNEFNDISTKEEIEEEEEYADSIC